VLNLEGKRQPIRRGHEEKAGERERAESWKELEMQDGVMWASAEGSKKSKSSC